MDSETKVLFFRHKKFSKFLAHAQCDYGLTFDPTWIEVHPFQEFFPRSVRGKSWNIPLCNMGVRFQSYNPLCAYTQLITALWGCGTVKTASSRLLGLWRRERELLQTSTSKINHLSSKVRSIGGCIGSCSASMSSSKMFSLRTLD